jgi:glucose/arabinose dehydrogenase/uncharacterized protein YecT (DUF1311 family)
VKPARLALCTLALLCAGAHGAQAASFDCAKARTPTEKMVCADPALGRLDEELDRVYGTALHQSRSPSALRQAQRTWLATRRDTCDDAACLRDAYLARLDALLDEASANPTNLTLGTGATVGVEPYATDARQCDGLPRQPIEMAKRMCAGLVVGPTQADPMRRIRMPRTLLELAPDDWLVSDFDAWTSKSGAIWRIRWRDGKPVPEKLLANLRLPHTLAWGPGKKVYASEMGRIFRFDPRATNPQATVETVIDGLPDNRLHANRHPIAAFLFAADGALLVNVGASTDQCLGANNVRAAATCIAAEVGEHEAGLRRYALAGPGKWSPEYTVYARGLRNSIALARHASGTILQGENSYDFEKRFEPFEELNVIEAGRHYGWPYCFDNDKVSPGWAGTTVADCSSQKYARPALLIPPHASPLGMAWYDGAMFPELQGKLLMGWHGYRSVGGRIVAFDTDASGVPLRTRRANFPTWGGAAMPYKAANAATAQVLTPGWNKVLGLRPQGSPVGLTVAKDGAIWTADDRAGTVIRIARDK